MDLLRSSTVIHMLSHSFAKTVGIIGLKQLVARRLEDRTIVFGSTNDKVGVGSKAPNFTLRSHVGEEVSLRHFLSIRPVVLFFYPKDDSPGCTMEACAFRGDYTEFGKLDAEVIGISPDSVDSHRREDARRVLLLRRTTVSWKSRWSSEPQSTG
jgi:hypothetical protein